MSTTPTEAHLRLANQLIGSPPSSLVWARVIADSEARAVEAETALLRKLYLSEKQAKVERGDMFCACQDALTAERERVRVLEEALIFIRDECDWEEPRGDFGVGGDSRIGPTIAAALATPANPPAANDAKEGSV